MDVLREDGRAAHEVCFFFFQAEDGIRDLTVTGVQTCALPISLAKKRAMPSGFMMNGPMPPAGSSSALKSRSEEHTSELQSQSNLVCRLLLEKKKKTNKKTSTDSIVTTD